jgi:hypothetical protein
MAGHQQHMPVRPHWAERTIPPEFAAPMKRAGKGIIPLVQALVSIPAAFVLVCTGLSSVEQRFLFIPAGLVIIIGLYAGACYIYGRRGLPIWYGHAAQIPHLVTPQQMTLWVVPIDPLLDRPSWIWGRKSLIGYLQEDRPSWGHPSYYLQEVIIGPPGDRINTRHVYIALPAPDVSSLDGKDVDVYFDPDPRGPVVIHTSLGWLVEYANAYTLFQRFPARDDNAR